MSAPSSARSRLYLPVNSLLHWLRWLLPLAALVLVFMAVSSQFRQIDMKVVHATFKQVSLWNTLWLIAAGLLVVSLGVLYDWLLQYWFNLRLKTAYVVRYAWLANALNNVAGLVGVTGAGVRYLALSNAGVAAKDAVALAGLVLFCMPVGLSLLATFVLVWHIDMLAKLSMPLSISLLVLGVVSAYWVLFLWVAGSGALHRRFLADTPPLALSHRLVLELVSLLDWLAAVVLLDLCLWVVGVELPFGALLAAFTVAATLGWVSMVPGGLGVFEGTMLVLLGGMAADATPVLAALLLFRVTYYFIPFLGSGSNLKSTV